LLYVLLHGVLGAVLCLLQGLRVGYGYVSAQIPLEPVVVLSLWRYNLITYWIVLVAIWGLPTLLGGAS
ncbi:MAG: hypothetical protein GX771_10845, partial [Halomonadaceae bacterium]|nr:hypothetical protein [Halomonadaceae bacterium]